MQELQEENISESVQVKYLQSKFAQVPSGDLKLISQL